MQQGKNWYALQNILGFQKFRGWNGRRLEKFIKIMVYFGGYDKKFQNVKNIVFIYRQRQNDQTDKTHVKTQMKTKLTRRIKK